MSLIKCTLMRGSNQMTLALFDARVGTTKEMGLGTTEAKHVKYSEIRQTIGDMVDDAIKYIHLTPAIMGGDPLKWNEPQEATRAIDMSRAAHVRPGQPQMAALPWCRSQSLSLNRACKANEDLFRRCVGQ